MYASTHDHEHLPFADLARWTGRLAGATLFVTWLGMVIAETIYEGFRPPAIESFFQAAALAVVFFGYAVGWHEEVLGGLFVVLGTVGYFLITALTGGLPPGIEAAWFAAPGVLYLLAARFNNRDLKASSD